jgi:hypothetical protein
MTTVSPPLALRSWQGQRMLALLCAVAFLAARSRRTRTISKEI